MGAEDRGKPSTWLIVGASRGIGHEFVEQLLARGDKVIATVRRDAQAFWPDKRDSCHVIICDVTEESSINVGVTAKTLRHSNV